MNTRKLWITALCALALIAGLVVLPAGPQTALAQGETGFNWLAFYWNNPTFSGDPTFSRVDPVINFNWGAGSPVPGIINAFNFSVRWSNRITFAAGTYRFRAGADDGIRVAVNGQIIIDRFTETDVFQVNTADVTLGAGQYEIIVDYFKGGTGNGGVLFDWTLATGPGGGILPTTAPGVLPGAPTATATPEMRAVVIVDRANVRSGPGLQYPTITQVLRDRVFRILARNGEFGFQTWFLIDLGDGARGWIYRQVIFPYNGDPSTLPRSQEVIDAAPLVAEAAPGQPAGVGPFEVQGVARNNAMVRSAPSTRTGEPIGVINRGEGFRILRLSANEAWVLVEYNGLQGWTFVLNVRVTLGNLGQLPRGN
jgi:uncharacterized protein YraI